MRQAGRATYAVWCGSEMTRINKIARHKLCPCVKSYRRFVEGGCRRHASERVFIWRYRPARRRKAQRLGVILHAQFLDLAGQGVTPPAQ